jgi:hypothetical protein
VALRAHYDYRRFGVILQKVHCAFLFYHLDCVLPPRELKDASSLVGIEDVSAADLKRVQDWIAACDAESVETCSISSSSSSCSSSCSSSRDSTVQECHSSSSSSSSNSSSARPDPCSRSKSWSVGGLHVEVAGANSSANWRSNLPPLHRPPQSFRKHAAEAVQQQQIVLGL